MSQIIAPAGGMSLGSEIAVLLLENEANHAESAQAARDAAREQFLARADEQVAALHAAATATMSGAFVGAALTAAGGALQMTSAVYTYDAKVGELTNGCTVEVASDRKMAALTAGLGSTSSALAEPVRTFTFDSTAKHREADAKHAETLAEQARWQAQDASQAIDKADRQSSKVLDSVQSLNAAQNAANNAVIGRI